MRDTPNVEQELDTSGTPPTGGSSENTSEASTPPTTATLTTEQRNVLIEDLMTKRLGGKVTVWPDWRYSIWLAHVKVKHWFGLHTYIPTELWNREAGTVQFAGDRCWICDERP